MYGGTDGWTKVQGQCFAHWTTWTLLYGGIDGTWTCWYFEQVKQSVEYSSKALRSAISSVGAIMTEMWLEH